MDIIFSSNTQPKANQPLIVPIFTTNAPISSLKHLSDEQIGLVQATLKHSHFTGKKSQICHARDEKNHIILFGLGDEKTFHQSTAGHAGAHIFSILKVTQTKEAGC